MSNYIPGYRKKLKTLARNEDQLIRLVDKAAAAETVNRAVEIVRQSIVRALQSQQAELDRHDPHIEIKINQALKMTADEIILQSRKKVGRRRK